MGVTSVTIILQEEHGWTGHLKNFDDRTGQRLETSASVLMNFDNRIGEWKRPRPVGTRGGWGEGSFTGRFFENSHGVSVGAGVGLGGEGTLASPSSCSLDHNTLPPGRRKRPLPSSTPLPPLQHSKNLPVKGGRGGGLVLVLVATRFARGSVKQHGRIPTRTSTRPPHPLHPTLCPYRRRHHRVVRIYHSCSIQDIYRSFCAVIFFCRDSGALPFPYSVVKHHQDGGDACNPMSRITPCGRQSLSGEQCRHCL